MATGKKFYWIKLRKDFMEGDVIDFLMNQDNGAEYVVLYQLLCMKCINTNGVMANSIGEVIVPYDVKKIQRDCKYFSIDTVICAMELFKKLGLIYEQENGILAISDFGEMVGYQTDYAIQKSNQRKNKDKNNMLGVDNVHSNVHSNVHIEKEKEKEIDIYMSVCGEKKPITQDGKPIKHFEDFWNNYPKQVHRALAEQEYVNQVLNGNLNEKWLVEAAKEYALCKKGCNDKYIKNPENWIKENLYLDYPPGTYEKQKAKNEENKPQPNPQNKNRSNSHEQRDYSSNELNDLEQKLLGHLKGGI